MHFFAVGPRNCFDFRLVLWLHKVFGSFSTLAFRGTGPAGSVLQQRWLRQCHQDRSEPARPAVWTGCLLKTWMVERWSKSGCGVKTLNEPKRNLFGILEGGLIFPRRSVPSFWPSEIVRPCRELLEDSWFLLLHQILVPRDFSASEAWSSDSKHQKALASRECSKRF